ncbi:hypothetical protein PSHT_02184, partial [Puccinia striiformis]
TKDDDQDDSNNIEPPPPLRSTAREVFKAISLFNNCIESNTSVDAEKLNQSMETYLEAPVGHLITAAQQKSIEAFFPPVVSLPGLIAQTWPSDLLSHGLVQAVGRHGTICSDRPV